MAKLTDTQLILLSKAAARDDGALIAPAKMHKPAAARAAASLVDRELMQETRAKPGMPVWREGPDGRGVSLIITRAGRDAIGVENAAKEPGSGDRGAETLDAPQPPASQPRPPAAETSSHQQADPAAASKAAPREGSKLAQAIAMLAKPEGTTIAALSSATGWQAHTARAVLTGLRKRGFAIERARAEGATASIYRILASACPAA